MSSWYALNASGNLPWYVLEFNLNIVLYCMYTYLLGCLVFNVCFSYVIQLGKRDLKKCIILKGVSINMP